MRQKLLRKLLPVLCLAGCAAGAAGSASAGTLKVGISDNSPAMFSNSYFQSLHLANARVMVDWNAAVMGNKTPLRRAAQWISAAQAAGITPLVTFLADPGRAGNHIPSVKEYTRAVKAFISRFPSVKEYIPWNEPDFNFRALSHQPALAAGYFNSLVSVCKGCTVVAGDVYLDAPHLGAWVRAYKRGLRYKPAAWALHPYFDVTAHTTAQIQVMLKATSGPLWLTEISGVLLRGHWNGNHVLRQTPAKQASDERFLFSLPSRFPRITRIYHYQWQGAPGFGWDSGLLNPNGSPRPAYYVLAKAAGSG